MSARGYRISTPRLIVLLAGLIVLACLFAQISHSRTFSSVEVKFTDASQQGLSIVPASCPSNPDFTGQCDPQQPPPGQCSLTSTSWVIAKGQNVTLSWNGPSGTFLGIPYNYQSGTITSLGAVGVSGSQPVSPTQTTTYVYSGNATYAGIFNVPFDCEGTITVLQNNPCPSGQQLGTDGFCHVSACPTGQHLGSDNVCHTTTCPSGTTLGSDGLCHTANCAAPFFFCGTGANADYVYQRTYTTAPQCSVQTNLVASCKFGCVSGVCISPPADPTAVLSAQPALLRPGQTTSLNWTTTDASSCTLKGSDGESWTGLYGTVTTAAIKSKTTFTLDCTAQNGGADITKTVTVNVIPTPIEL